MSVVSVISSEPSRPAARKSGAKISASRMPLRPLSAGAVARIRPAPSMMAKMRPASTACGSEHGCEVLRIGHPVAGAGGKPSSEDCRQFARRDLQMHHRLPVMGIEMVVATDQELQRQRRPERHQEQHDQHRDQVPERRLGYLDAGKPVHGERQPKRALASKQLEQLSLGQVLSPRMRQPPRGLQIRNLLIRKSSDLASRLRKAAPQLDRLRPRNDRLSDRSVMSLRNNHARLCQTARGKLQAAYLRSQIVASSWGKSCRAELVH